MLLGHLSVHTQLPLQHVRDAILQTCADCLATVSVDVPNAAAGSMFPTWCKVKGFLCCATAYLNFRINVYLGSAAVPPEYIVEVHRDAGSRYAVLQVTERLKQLLQAWPVMPQWTFTGEAQPIANGSVAASTEAEDKNEDDAMQGDGDGDGAAATPLDFTAGREYFLTGLNSPYDKTITDSLSALCGFAHDALQNAGAASHTATGILAALGNWDKILHAILDRLVDRRTSIVTQTLAAACLHLLLTIRHVVQGSEPEPLHAVRPTFAFDVALILQRAALEIGPASSATAAETMWQRRPLQRYLLDIWQLVMLHFTSRDAALTSDVLALHGSVSRVLGVLGNYAGRYAPLRGAAAGLQAAYGEFAARATAAAAEAAAAAAAAAAKPPPGPPHETVMCSRIIHQCTDRQERFTKSQRFLRILQHSAPWATGPPWPRPASSPFPCDNCHRRFVTPPVFLVMKMLDGQHQEDGNFCSGPCANTYLHTYLRDGYLAERAAHLLEYMQTVHGFRGLNIGFAPRFQELQRYGGDLTDAQFDAIVGNPDLTTIQLQRPFIPTEIVIEWRCTKDSNTHHAAVSAGVPEPVPETAASSAKTAAVSAAPASILESVMGPSTLNTKHHQKWDVTNLQQPPLEDIKDRLANLPPCGTFKGAWEVFMEQTTAAGTPGVVPGLVTKKTTGSGSKSGKAAPGAGAGKSGGTATETTAGAEGNPAPATAADGASGDAAAAVPAAPVSASASASASKK
jgi:hypothetical protein